MVISPPPPPKSISPRKRWYSAVSPRPFGLRLAALFDVNPVVVILLVASLTLPALTLWSFHRHRFQRRNQPASATSHQRHLASSRQRRGSGWNILQPLALPTQSSRGLGNSPEVWRHRLRSRVRAQLIRFSTQSRAGFPAGHPYADLRSSDKMRNRSDFRRLQPQTQHSR